MNNSTYQVSFQNPVLSHFGQNTLLLHDHTDPQYRKMLDAFAGSGDYLINLSAELVHIAHQIKKSSPKASRSLIKLSRDLSYIDDKYTIVKKNSNRT